MMWTQTALRISENQSHQGREDMPGRSDSRILHSLNTLVRKPLFSAFLLFVVIFASPRVYGQSTSASLTGLIDDPARAVIVGAQITAINTETGVKTSTTSNREGQYVLPNLQPGSYRLEVDKPGFKGILSAK